MKIYLIGGKARNGKDTLAKFLKEAEEINNKKVCIMQISNPLKHYAKDHFNWDGKESTKPRSLLTEIGTEVIRVKMKQDEFLIKRLVEDLQVLENYFDVAIISDVRLVLEYDYVKKSYPDAITIKIKREDFESNLSNDQKNHLTETGLDNYNDVDYLIINKTLKDLKLQANKLVNEKR